MKKRTPYINVWKELSHDKAMIFLAGPASQVRRHLQRLLPNRLAIVFIGTGI